MSSVSPGTSAGQWQKMQSEQHALRKSFSATPQSVPIARHLLIGFTQRCCPDAPDIIDAVALTVTEAVANVVRHAYPDTTGTVEITATIDDESLLITISDHGVGMATTTSNPGQGLGLPIMRRMAKATLKSLPAGGVHVTLCFSCTPCR